MSDLGRIGFGIELTGPTGACIRRQRERGPPPDSATVGVDRPHAANNARIMPWRGIIFPIVGVWRTPCRHTPLTHHRATSYRYAVSNTLPLTRAAKQKRSGPRRPANPNQENHAPSRRRCNRRRFRPDSGIGPIHFEGLQLQEEFPLHVFKACPRVGCPIAPVRPCGISCRPASLLRTSAHASPHRSPTSTGRRNVARSLFDT
jgi:hypothetical protein